MPLTPHLGVELASSYATYASEIQQLHQTLRDHCARPSVKNHSQLPRCLSCTLELELSYMRLRRTRPRVVWEISPMHGFTTVMILSALARNNNSAKLHSFDRHGGVKRFLTKSRYPALTPLWVFHLGDVRQLVAKALRSGDQRSEPLFELAPRPNYLFLDSWHSEEMGVFYTETLLPRLQRWHTHVSLHDVYNPLFWTDEAPKRDLSLYPSDMPNYEGQIVLDWLAYPHLADACALFTASPAKRGNAPFHAAIVRRRAGVGIAPTELLDPHKGACPEPTIYFELGCTAGVAREVHHRRSSNRSAAGHAKKSASKHGRGVAAA